MKILLLEDEIMLKNTLEEYLLGLGHVVSSFSRGDRALNALRQNSYDMIILDINVPKISGFELVKKLQEESIQTPIVFISALIGIDEISEAFSLGAADYLKKPFHLKELALRIDKIKKEMDSKNSHHVIISKNYAYSKEEKQLYYNHTPVDLTKRWLQIVTLLCENINSVVHFNTFRNFVWSEEWVDNATIRAEISRFRKTLNEDFIVNVKGVGYKINKYFATQK